MTEYLSSFLTQFFYYQWLGVLFICLLLAIVTYLTYRICKELGIGRILLLYYLPSLIIVSLYIGNSLVSSLGTIFAFLFFFFYLKISDRKKRLLYTVIAFVLLYFLAGGYSFIFLFSAITSEGVMFRNKRSILQVFVYLLCGAAVPMIAMRWLFVISFKDSFTQLLPLYPSFGVPMAQWGHLLYLPVLAPISLIRIPLKGRGLILTAKIVPLIVVFLLTVYVFKVSINEDFRLIMDIEKYAVDEEWIDLLELSAMNPNSSDVNAAYTNLALYKVGRLPWDMYRFSHMHFEDGLIPKWNGSQNILMAGSDIYFQLGMTNASYRWAYEYMVSVGESPRVLKRLAMTSLINKDYPVAKKYLSILSKTLFCRGWARHYESFLYAGNKIDTDAYLGRKASEVVHENTFVPIINNQHNFEVLLRANSNNKMAYEYLLAQLLFKKDLEAFAKQIVRIGEYGYSEMPKLWGEALMVHNILFDDNRIKIEGFPVSDETYKRFEAYSEVFPQYLKNREQGLIALRKEFGDTYWYYHHFDKLRKSSNSKSHRIDR